MIRINELNPERRALIDAEIARSTSEIIDPDLDCRDPIRVGRLIQYEGGYSKAAFGESAGPGREYVHDFVDPPDGHLILTEDNLPLGDSRGPLALCSAIVGSKEVFYATTLKGRQSIRKITEAA
jgi:hypothetical protein